MNCGTSTACCDITHIPFSLFPSKYPLSVFEDRLFFVFFCFFLFFFVFFCFFPSYFYLYIPFSLFPSKYPLSVFEDRSFFFSSSSFIIFSLFSFILLSSYSFSLFFLPNILCPCLKIVFYYYSFVFFLSFILYIPFSLSFFLSLLLFLFFLRNIPLSIFLENHLFFSSSFLFLFLPFSPSSPPLLTPPTKSRKSSTNFP